MESDVWTTSDTDPMSNYYRELSTTNDDTPWYAKPAEVVDDVVGWLFRTREERAAREHEKELARIRAQGGFTSTATTGTVIAVGVGAVALGAVLFGRKRRRR